MVDETRVGYQVSALVRNVLGQETEIPWRHICEIVQSIEDAIGRADWLSSDTGMQFDLTPTSKARRAEMVAARIKKEQEQCGQ